MGRKLRFFSLSTGVVTLLMLGACSTNSGPQMDPEKMAALEAPGIDYVPSQIITVEDVEKDPYVIGDRGTLIYVQKDALLDADGNPINTNIQLELKEIQAMDDFKGARVSTLAGDQLLSTAGTYYLNATSDGQQLRVNPEVGLSVAFPAIDEDPDIELFQGEPTEDGDINWVPLGVAETPVPKPTIEEPKNLTDFEGKRQLESAKALLADIDANFERVGSEYLHKTDPDKRMRWSVGYVKDLRASYEYHKHKMVVYEQQEEAFRIAYEKYLNHPEIKAWKAYKEEKKEQLQEQKSVFEYNLPYVGWINLDKYLKEDIVEYKGSLAYENGSTADVARVHLMSRKERIHLTQVITNGQFSFQFPKGRSFEVYATTIDQELHRDFDGSVTELGELVLTPIPPEAREVKAALVAP